MRHCSALEHKHQMMPRSKAFRLAGKYSTFPLTLAAIENHHLSHPTVNQVLCSSFKSFLGEALSLHDKISQNRVCVCVCVCVNFLLKFDPEFLKPIKLTWLFKNLNFTFIQAFHSQIKASEKTFSNTTVTKKGERSPWWRKGSLRHSKSAPKDTFRKQTTRKHAQLLTRPDQGSLSAHNRLLSINCQAALSLWNQEGSQALAWVVSFPKLHISIVQV